MAIKVPQNLELLKEINAELDKQIAIDNKINGTEEELLQHRRESLQEEARRNELGRAQIMQQLEAIENLRLHNELSKENYEMEMKAAADALKYLNTKREQNILDQNNLRMEEKSVEFKEKALELTDQMLALIMEIVKQQDAALAAFAASTGAGRRFETLILDVTDELYAYNVNITDVTAAHQSLMSQFGNLSRLTQQQSRDLLVLTAQLKAVGVATDTSAQMFNVMANSLEMTQGEMQQATFDLHALGQTLHMSTAQVAQDFVQLSGNLAKYGDQMIEVFKGLEAAAKATGIAVGELYNVTSRFDSFEGAASAAGQLNAILGGNLVSSMQLLNATEEDRIGLLIRAREESGRTWQSMNRWEKQALATAAGFNSVAEAGQVFNQTFSEFQASQRQAQQLAGSQENFNEAMEAAINLWDRFKSYMLDAFAWPIWVFTQLIRLVGEFLQFLKELGPAGQIVIRVLGTIAVSALLAFTVLHRFKIIKGILLGVGKALGIVKTELAASAPTNGIASKGFMALAKSIFVLGAALLVAGAGIWLITKGFANLLDAIGKNPEQAWKAVEVFAALLGIITALAALMAAPVIGQALLVGFVFLAAGITAVGVAVMILGAGLHLVGSGMQAISEAVVTMAAGFRGIVESILTPAALSGMAILVSELFGMAAALALIKTADLVAVGVTMRATGDIVSSAGSMGPSAVENTSKLFETVSNFITNTAENTSEETVQTLRGVAQVVGNSSGGTGGGGVSSGPTTIIINLNEREFARAVLKVMNSRIYNGSLQEE